MILKSNDASISKLSRDGHSLEQFLRLRTLRCFLIDLIKKISTGTPKMKLGNCNFCKEKVCVTMNIVSNKDLLEGFRHFDCYLLE